MGELQEIVVHSTILRKSFWVFKQRNGVFRFVFGERTNGQDGSCLGDMESRDKEDLN